VRVAHQGNFTAFVGAWTAHSNSAAFNTSSFGTGTYRFAYTSAESGSLGNFIDNAAFGVGVIPEPSTVALLAIAGCVALSDWGARWPSARFIPVKAKGGGVSPAASASFAR